MGVVAKYVEEEGGAGRKNHLRIYFRSVNFAHLTLNGLLCDYDLVSLNLLVIIACQGDIKEVFVLPQLLERRAELVLKVIPPKTKLFCW